MTDIVCKRCGNCCHHVNDEGKVVKCKHLVKLANGKTLCRIYKKRLGAFCDDEHKRFCVLRENSQYNYEGCVFNYLDSSKPMFPTKK